MSSEAQFVIRREIQGTVDYYSMWGGFSEFKYDGYKYPTPEEANHNITALKRSDKLHNRASTKYFIEEWRESEWPEESSQ